MKYSLTLALFLGLVESRSTGRRSTGGSSGSGTTMKVFPPMPAVPQPSDGANAAAAAAVAAMEPKIPSRLNIAAGASSMGLNIDQTAVRDVMQSGERFLK